MPRDESTGATSRKHWYRDLKRDGAFVRRQPLILDELLLDTPTGEGARFPLELTERRYDGSSTACCPQHGTDEWHLFMINHNRAT